MEFNWASVIQEVMKKQLNNLRGARPLSLLTFLYHLYAGQNQLTREELKELKVMKECLKFGADDVDSSDSSLEEDDKAKSSPPAKKKKVEPVEPAQAEPVTPESQTVKSKSPSYEPSPCGETSTTFHFLRGMINKLYNRMAHFEFALARACDIVKATPETLPDKLTDLMARSDNRDKINRLKSRLEMAQTRLGQEEKLRAQLLAQQASADLQLLERGEILGELKKYLDGVMQVTHFGVKSLVGKFAYCNYLSKEQQTPNVSKVIRVVSEYSDKVQAMVDGAEKATTTLQKLYTLLPPPPGFALVNVHTFVRQRFVDQTVGRGGSN